MSYKHLSLEERHYIEISLRNEESHEVIAESLDRSQSKVDPIVKTSQLKNKI